MIPNNIKDSAPWSADMVPDGPDTYGDDPTGGTMSHDTPGSLYDDLPDIAVPKRRVTS